MGHPDDERSRLTRVPPQGAIVAVLAIAGLASSFMFTLVVPIQAKLPELLHASREDTAWVVTATLLAAAVITPISGRLGDMYGKRRIVLVLLGQDPETRVAAPVRDPRVSEDTGEPVTGSVRVPGRAGVFATMWRHRDVLSRLGLAAASLSALRSVRQTVLPLWGVSIGLDAQTIALVVGISGAIDFALFYASGQVMDRFGRLWAALPAMLLMGAGFLALAFTHDLPQAAMWFAMFAAVLGVGNGLSSGILLTLGADVAPQTDPAAFLGSWRTITDAGGAAAPVIVSGVTALSSLAVATGLMGVVGLLGAAAFLRWVPRFVPRR